MAQGEKDPLRFVPGQAEFVVTIRNPPGVISMVEKRDVFQNALKLAGVREFYDTANFHRFYQLVRYFEKELGQDRDGILADLSAGGVAIAAKLTQPGGAVAVVQSRDEARLRKFVELSLSVLQQELDRQESKDRIVRKKYNGVDVGQIGPKLSFALVDGAFILASEPAALKLALDTRSGTGDIRQLPNFQMARVKQPKGALASAWLHLEELRKNQNFQNGLNAAGMDPFQMLLFGGLSDVLKRAPYLSASLLRDGSDFRISAVMPAGRDRMAPVRHLLVPPDDACAFAPLHPPRTISSSSYFLDLGQLWNKRHEILGEKNAKGLEEGDRNLAKVLGGVKLATLFQNSGTSHRLVFAQQKDRPYKTRPMIPFPAFALVVDMRSPAFAQEINTVFRSAALLATFSFGLQLREEEQEGCNLVSYYFSETKKVEGDPDGIRFNFSPTYVSVGDSFVMSATAELAKDLVTELRKEKRVRSPKTSMRTNLHAAGLADVGRGNYDEGLTNLILKLAIPPSAAKTELQAILDWTESLGTLSLQSRYLANEYQYEVLWRLKRK